MGTNHVQLPILPALRARARARARADDLRFQIHRSGHGAGYVHQRLWQAKLTRSHARSSLTQWGLCYAMLPVPR